MYKLNQTSYIIRTFLLLFVSALLCAQLVNGQKVDSANLSSQIRHDMYIQKWKLNRTIGGIFSGAGLAMVGLAYVAAWQAFGEPDSNAGQGLLIAGATSMALSIPFIIWALNNKKKARLALKTETANITIRKCSYLAVAMKITL